MRVPTQVLVGGHKIAIKYRESIVEPDGECLSGQTLAESPWTIEIAKDRHKNEQQLFVTLFHELIHVALAVTGISATWTDAQEEPVAYGCENMLAGLFVFSPKAKIRWRDIKFPHETGDSDD